MTVKPILAALAVLAIIPGVAGASGNAVLVQGVPPDLVCGDAIVVGVWARDPGPRKVTITARDQGQRSRVVEPHPVRAALALADLVPTERVEG